MSTSGDRCAYFDGSAYLLALRFFFGLEEGSGTLLTAGGAFVLVRFLGCRTDADAKDSFGTADVSVYVYLVNRSLNDVEGDVAGLSSGSERPPSLGTCFGALSDFAERVRGIAARQLN